MSQDKARKQGEEEGKKGLPASLSLQLNAEECGSAVNSKEEWWAVESAGGLHTSQQEVVWKCQQGIGRIQTVPWSPMTYGPQKTGELSRECATEAMVSEESWDSVKETGGRGWQRACECRGGCC